MKINNEQLEALLRQQEQSSGTVRKPGGQGAGFEAALAEQLGLGGVGASSTAEGTPSIGSMQTAQASQASMISQMLLGATGEADETNPTEDVLKDAFNQASGTLDMWILTSAPWVVPVIMVPCAKHMPFCRALTARLPH